MLTIFLKPIAIEKGHCLKGEGHIGNASLLKKYQDRVIPEPGPVGTEWASTSARQEGFFAGMSGGSTFAAAMQVVQKADQESVILCILPDTGQRYLSLKESRRT